MRQEAVHDLPPQAPAAENLPGLRGVQEALAGGLAAALSSLLRCPLAVTLVGLDRLPYGEFVGGLRTPTCFNVLRAEPLEDRLMLDVEPSILYPMMDCLLGGGGREGPPPGRPLGEVELPLAARIVGLFLEELRRAWQNVVELKLDALRMESNPRLLRLLPADEEVLLVSLRVELGPRQGMMRLCLPRRAMQRLEEAATLVEVDVVLATTTVSADDLRNLRPGDIIIADTVADSPAVVSLAGQARFHAQPGTAGGRRAVRISGPIERGDK
jgi:flagellar motor switch protein FliM